MSRLAVVTGGSRGIGAATAVLLAERGWDVCVGYHADAAAAAHVVEACRGRSREAIAVKLDVAVEQDVLGLFAKCDEIGPIDVLVNNAGIVASKSRVDEMTSERISRMMAVNVIGSFLCAREAVRRISTLHGGQGGSIVNVSSAASRIGSSGEYVDYAASKGAVDTMTLGLAREVAAEGIRVNGVRPGFIETDIHAASGQSNRLAELEPTIPMRRRGQPIEVAEAIVWLCSEAASYVTGAMLDLAGGR